MAEYKNTNREYVGDSYDDNKLNKNMELNDSMSIQNEAPDEYTRKVRGGNNGE